MKQLSQSPTDPAFVQNPYPFYDTARALGDVFWWDDYDMPCAVSYDAVRIALKDRRLGRECPPEFARPVPDALRPFYDVEAHSMLELEPPRHTRLRALVLRAFTSRRIGALAPEITALCNDLIDRFPTGAHDLLTGFAQPIPVLIIARLLGVPDDCKDDLLRWSNAMVAMYQARRTPDIEQAAVQATLAFSAFLADHIRHKSKYPADDLISALIAATEDGKSLSHEELVTTCILLLNAGHEATVHTLGNGAKTLIENGKPAITPASVEEILRYDPPLHMFTRHVYEDVEIGGQVFHRGTEIACLLGAANRDPKAFAKPNQFDPARKALPNTSFGGGIHFCVGAPLARLELQIGLETLFNRCPAIAFAQAPTYSDVYHFHGLAALMVTT